VKLDDALIHVSLLALDTPPVIYFVEAHPRYGPLMAEVFRRVGDGKLSVCTSVITVGEVLVQPLLHGDVGLVRSYDTLLRRNDWCDTVSLDYTAAERAADLRARYNLRLPDALQIAAALGKSCDAFLTNDLQFKRVVELPILTLDELEL
jgi:predicted nucleic acid-binding protein